METDRGKRLKSMASHSLFWLILWACVLGLAPILALAQPPLPPPSYGIYLQKGDVLVKLSYQQARRVPVGEMGYVMGIMHRTRVFLMGERSEVRTSDRRPCLYFYGANPREFYSMVILHKRDGIREFHYSIYPAGGSAQVVDEYRVGVQTEEVSKDLYRLLPDQALDPGEYGIVLGNTLYAFGVDPQDR